MIIKNYPLKKCLEDYLTDESILSGVNSLLAKWNTLPQHMEWKDLAQFYDAMEAAYRIMVEYSRSMSELWTLVWADAIPDGWQPLSPHLQIVDDKDANPNPAVCFEYSWFNRTFEKDGQRLYTSISLEDIGVRVGVGLFSDVRPLARKGSSPIGFEYDKESDLAWTDPFGIKDGKTIEEGKKVELGPLREARDNALTWVAEVAGRP